MQRIFGILVCRRKRKVFFWIFTILLFCALLHLLNSSAYNKKKQTYIAYLKSFTRTYSNAHVVARQRLKVTGSCSKPDLPMWNSDIENYINPVDPISCQAEPEWVYTERGRFYISQHASHVHGYITCKYTPYVNDADYYKALDAVENVRNSSLMMSDVFHVDCKAEDGQRYERYHACIAKTPDTGESGVPSGGQYSVFMLGYDSLSRLMLMRLLPKTFAYFTDDLRGEVLEGYNIIGDGTPQALMPILTGQQETEVREMRKGQPGAVHVDEALNFVWSKFQKKGYVTQFAEDEHHSSAFNTRLLGFKTQPTHHYMRPFYLLAQPAFRHHHKLCYGSKSRHQLFLDWLQEGLVTNKGRPFFTFGFLTEMSHNDNSPVHLCDDDIVKFMKFMKNEGFLNNTIFILMSDHGARHGSLRRTEQGKIEERSPFVGVYLPETFKKRYPEKVEALSINSRRLTSPFDIYETFIDMLEDFHGENTDRHNIGIDLLKQRNAQRGISLFKEIPANRTCADVGIEAHWCACVQWVTISVTDARVVAAVSNVIDAINALLNEHRNVCHLISILSINKAVMYKSSEQMLMFKGSKDNDGRVPMLDGDARLGIEYIQVTFTTSPGSGLFEATVLHDVEQRQYHVDDKDISRLNWYGDASKCISDKFPKLRPYCVCI